MIARQNINMSMIAGHNINMPMIAGHNINMPMIAGHTINMPMIAGHNINIYSCAKCLAYQRVCEKSPPSMCIPMSRFCTRLLGAQTGSLSIGARLLLSSWLSFPQIITNSFD